jgi:hypothetical protein
MHLTRRCTTFATALLILAISAGCAATSSAPSPDEDPLWTSRRADLTPAERIDAIRRVKAAVHAGEADRLVVRHAMTEMAWALETPEPVRAAALEAVLWDPEAEDDSRRLVREMLPTEPGRTCVAVMATAIADHAWTDATPALVRSLARSVPGLEITQRAEYLALRRLHPDQPPEQVALDVFLEPRTDPGPAGLQLDMRTREAAWEVIGRLTPDGRARAALLRDSNAGDAEGRAILDKLRAVEQAFGVVPARAEEMRWAARLADERQGRLADWWRQTAAGVAQLPPSARPGLALRHLEPVRWASIHQPDWLASDLPALLARLDTRLAGRQVYARTEAIRGTATATAERFSRARDSLIWGDALALLVIDRALEDGDARAQIFSAAEADARDRTTEHGGLLRAGQQGGFRIQPFIPRGTATPDDRRFVAPREMIDYSGDALAHFHFHVARWRNRDYAGPSPEDVDYAARFGRVCLVLTSIERNLLNADVYFPDGTIVDLGDVRPPASAR